MVKKTINFTDPKILDDFDKKIVSEYGTVRGNRTKVLETFMIDYTSGKYTKINKELIEFKEKMPEMSSKYDEVLLKYTRLKDDNEKYRCDIDELFENVENLEKEINKLRLENEHLKELLSERNERISEYRSTIETNTDTINSLNKKITTKENDYKHLEEVRNKDLKEKQELSNKIGKYSYVIGYIENMSLLDRIRKKYPDEMKALPENTEK